MPTCYCYTERLNWFTGVALRLPSRQENVLLVHQRTFGGLYGCCPRFLRVLRFLDSRRSVLTDRQTKWGCEDLNLRPRGSKPRMLTKLHHIPLIGRVGVESLLRSY